ncbi:VOC family protein [Roseibium sp. H3510]|uniref:VOC family protein n=1 Tax=Roseibium algae TaxID=3123038 RepID=A0ABU8TI95_9HYPH
MPKCIATIALLVREYDEAIAFYCEKLGFQLVEDTQLSPNKRWVLVSPTGGGCQLLLARADGADQTAAVGNQTGGRVGFFLETDDFEADYARMTSAGVHFQEQPRVEAYG